MSCNETDLSPTFLAGNLVFQKKSDLCMKHSESVLKQIHPMSVTPKRHN